MRRFRISKLGELDAGTRSRVIGPATLDDLRRDKAARRLPVAGDLLVTGGNSHLTVKVRPSHTSSYVRGRLRMSPDKRRFRRVPYPGYARVGSHEPRVSLSSPSTDWVPLVPRTWGPGMARSQTHAIFQLPEGATDVSPGRSPPQRTKSWESPRKQLQPRRGDRTLVKGTGW